MAAAARAQEASSSMSRCTYHAFLSFRGEDTRKNFTDHLYTALVQAGIHTFRDDDEIKRGENIDAELQKAIKESKISIIVFSKDYASSRWCLDELVTIMERTRTGGHTVVPVFYDVDPSHVRKQTGSFAEAFARHEKQFKEEMDKVKKWRAALREVADLAGMVLGNRYESQFIQNIVTEIRNKLNQTVVLNVAPYLVGIDSHVEDINLWVQDGSNDVRIAMIYGIGGIGKTTIAKTIYNHNFDRFEGRSFLGNIRDTTKQPNGLVCLQRQLLSEILKEKTSKIYHKDVGIIKIKDAICCRRVLIVLDDVDQLDQLDAIIGNREWLNQGSKLIITTRHERLLTDHEVCVKFRVKELDDNQSLQLFSWYAFRLHNPPKNYMKCSRVVHHCGGIPLALKVLGSSLSGKDSDVWEDELQKLETIPKSEIQKVLEISYDSLQDDHDKSLFLDIACFFIGVDKDYTAGILKGCGFRPIVGFQNLIDKCLLTITWNNKLMMHQLLRDMGREIVRQESTEDPEKRSRLWHHKEALTILKEKTGTETIKGLTFDLRRLMEDKHGKTINTCSANSSFLSNEADMETETFMKMQKLKLLQLNYVNLRGDYESFPKSLIWLCWHGCPLKYLPDDFHLEKLVALDMRYSRLKYVWKGTKFLAELKFLNLSHCHVLVRTPDFSRVRMLEKLMLKDCINLVEISESIGNLDQLVLLNLEDCKNLRKLPRKFGLLKSLEELILSGCSKLDELPEDMGEMKSLKVLRADGIARNQLVSTTSDTNIFNLLSTRSRHSILRSLLSPRKGLRTTSFSLPLLPHSLVKLTLANSNLSDDAISYGLSRLPSLKYLDLSGNSFHSLSITGHTMLKELYLEHCTGLRSLPELPMSLMEMVLDYCTSLERVPKIPNFSLRYPVYCLNNLHEIQGLFKLEPIRNADTTMIKSLGLSNLKSLESIKMDLYSIITWQEWKTSLQVLHECNVLSIFLPRSEIPGSFIHQSMGSSIAVDVPSLVGYKVCGFNLCVLYAFDLCGVSPWDPYYVKINNKTKRMRWSYSPICYAIGEYDNLWLSHWKLGDHLEGGDQIDVSVVLQHGFEVKKCGIFFVHEDEDKVGQSNSEESVLSTYPWYHILTLTQGGACHHSLGTLDLGRFHPGEGLPSYPQVELETCMICDYLSERWESQPI